MTTTQLKREIKKRIDAIPEAKLKSLSDFVAFLAAPSVSDMIRQAKKDFDHGKGVNWRTVRDDV
jgi:hypothetical protein